MLFFERDKEVTLRCDVKCSNPNTDLEYVWELKKESGPNQVLDTKKNVNTYKFKPVDLGVSSPFGIVCTAKNSIVNVNSISDSQTEFTMIYKEPHTTTTTKEATTTTTAAQVDGTTNSATTTTTTSPTTVQGNQTTTTATTTTSNSSATNSFSLALFSALIALKLFFF